jgi:hypothetical protein
LILLLFYWPVRLGVRTQDFHSCNTGSIPVRAANSPNVRELLILLLFYWPVRLGVRTQDFHSCNTGSIPVRAAIKLCCFYSRAFFVPIPRQHCTAKSGAVLPGQALGFWFFEKNQALWGARFVSS